MLTRKLRMVVSLLLTALMLALSVPAYAAPTATPEPSLPPFDELTPAYDENAPENLSVDQLYSSAAILINEDTGEVLLQKNADQRMYPASTTKIMTALLALEYGNINAIAAVGMGQVRIGGMVSQVDNINRILDRVAIYLA